MDVVLCHAEDDNICQTIAEGLSVVQNKKSIVRVSMIQVKRWEE